jgi:hypothetical protein
VTPSKPASTPKTAWSGSRGGHARNPASRSRAVPQARLGLQRVTISVVMPRVSQDAFKRALLLDGVRPGPVRGSFAGHLGPNRASSERTHLAATSARHGCASWLTVLLRPKTGAQLAMSRLLLSIAHSMAIKVWPWSAGSISGWITPVRVRGAVRRGGTPQCHLPARPGRRLPRFP